VLSCDLSLITMHISDCCQFSDIHISQGSVTTYLRCGGIFKYSFITNLLQSLTANLLQIYQWVCQWKNFENRLTFGKVMGKSLVSCFFETQCSLKHQLFADLRKKFYFYIGLGLLSFTLLLVDLTFFVFSSVWRRSSSTRSWLQSATQT